MAALRWPTLALVAGLGLAFMLGFPRRRESRRDKKRRAHRRRMRKRRDKRAQDLHDRYYTMAIYERGGTPAVAAYLAERSKMAWKPVVLRAEEA